MPSVIRLQDYAHVVLPSLYQQQTHLTKYSRWRDDLGRRETWPETVLRYIDFMVDHAAHKLGYRIPEAMQVALYEGILRLEVMPSMRAMMVAGPALERDNAAAYNCAYTAVDRLKAHDEAFYLSMCSVGVGFSVERKFVGQLPQLPRELRSDGRLICVGDSRIGWARSYNSLLTSLFDGRVPDWDTSLVRPAGARLVCFGGRASGPEPLEALFRHTVALVREAVAAGRERLTPYQNHDLMTKMADVAVAGGVRRAATISLSDPDDEQMRDAKSGEWWKDKPHFRLANNSGMWDGQPSRAEFQAEWDALVRSGSGERGFVNRRALEAIARRARRVDVDLWRDLYGVNPCVEIVLRRNQFCNLTTNIVRAWDTLATLSRKVLLSTVLGTLQSTLTDFRYLSSDWRRNCEEERLLGVSLNGVMDNRFMAGLDHVRGTASPSADFVVDGVQVDLPGALAHLRDVAVATNKDWADRLGVNASAAITCVKPEGNNSNLVGCNSGLHGAHAARRYIRTNRANKVDPMAQFLVAQGVVHEDDVAAPDNALVLYFPMEVPEGAVTRHDYSALEHLAVWRVYQDHWCEHKPSVTVSVRDDEWAAVGDHVYENFDVVSGVAFLPFDGGTYRQAPFMDATEEEWRRLRDVTPQSIDWSLFSEDDDNTEGSRELACVGGACAI